jgi:hypothetical protein
MKTGRYLAALLLAVTMIVAAAGAQDTGNGTGAPPSGQPETTAPQQGNSPQDANVQDVSWSPQDNGNGNGNGANPQGMPAQDNSQGLPPDDSTRPQLQTRDGNNSQPQSSVARVSLVHGNVSMQRGDSSDWSAVTMNTPLVPGDQIATAEKSRAEVQLDFANVLRLAGGSQAKIADLGKSRIQVQVALGYASYSVYKNNEADIELDTPNVSVHPTRPGVYRVQVTSDSETNVIVRAGEAEVTTPQGSTTVKEGELISIRGTDNPEYKVESAPPGDDWDRWNGDRDRSIENASSWQNTNHYYTGANDLDNNGRWINVPGYGQVWQPNNQGPDWAPYQDGRWVWEPGWGWTWASNEPWGWAPYHYGRWFYWNTGWVWWPGPVYPYYRPLWAPAYVSFFGYGGGFGFGFGVGWLPCGPFDPFFPWYGPAFFGRVGFVGFVGFGHPFHGPFIRPLGIAGRHPFISNTRLALTNPHVRAGITSVSREEFARGGMAGRQRGMSEGTLRGARTMTGSLPVVPTRDSLHTGAVRTGFNGVARNNSHFVTRGATPAGPPAFHQQAAQMQNAVQNAARNGGQSQNSRFGNNEPMGMTRGQTGSPTFSRPGTMETTRNNAGQANTMSQSRGEGWRSFGGNAGQTQNGSRTTAQGNSGAMPRNDRPGWSSGGGNMSKPPLRMGNPIVTPRASAPTNTYSRPSSPSQPSGQSYGGYNSSHGVSPGSYNNRGYNNSGGYNAPSNRGYSSGGYSSRGYSGGGYSGHSSGGSTGSRGYSGGGRSSGGSSHGSSGGGHSNSGGGHSNGGHR